jgi:hypothetical protein
VGHKRGREQEQAIPFKALIDRLMMLGESPDPTERADAAAVVRSVDRAARQLRQDSAAAMAAASNLDALLDVLVDAAASLPQKAPLLALTVGLAAAGDEGAAAAVPGSDGGGGGGGTSGSNDAARSCAQQLVARVASALEASLAREAGAGRLASRCYLRFLACLAPAGVVTPRSLARLLQQLAGAARSAAAGDLGRGDPHGHTWQPWADELALAVVTEALPYCGAALATGAPRELEALRDELDTYVFGGGGGSGGGGGNGNSNTSGSRPLTFDAEMRPFGVGVPEATAAADADRFVAAGGRAVTGDPTLAGDSGAGTALPAAWRAVRDCGWPAADNEDNDAAAAQPPSDPWNLLSVPTLDARTEERLAQSALSPEEIPAVAVPAEPPGLAAQATAAAAQAAEFLAAASNAAPPSAEAVYACLAAAARAAYPPPGLLRFLPSDKTDAGRPSADRVVADGLVAATTAALSAHRVEAAAALARGLPLPYPHDGVLAEALLGAQVMCLPRCPGREPGAAGALLMDVCRLSPQFPRYLAAAAREAYSRAQRIDPHALNALSAYLAHHISSFGWVWFWDRWSAAARGHPRSARARFCATIIGRLLRLSYRDHVAKKLPEVFLPMLGPAQEPLGLPPVEPYDPDGVGGEEEQQEDEEGGGSTADDKEESRWAGRLVGVLRYRRQSGADGPMPLPPDEVLDWMRRPGGMFESLAGGGGEDVAMAAEGDDGSGLPPPSRRALRAVARALLALGAKTPTHTAAALERMAPALSPLFLAAGGGRPALEAAGALWRRSPQRLSLTVERLVDARYARARDVPVWLSERFDGLALDPPLVPPAPVAPPEGEGEEDEAAAASAFAEVTAAREAALELCREHLMLEDAAHELILECTARCEAEAEAAEADEREAAGDARAAEEAVARAEQQQAAQQQQAQPGLIDFSARDAAAARLRLEEASRRRERAAEAARAARAELMATARASLEALAGWAARAAGEEEGGAAMEEGDEGQEEEEARAEPAAPRRCAHVRAYARRFAAAAAPAAADLAAMAAALPAPVRAAVLGPLRLLSVV